MLTNTEILLTGGCLPSMQEAIGWLFNTALAGHSSKHLKEIQGHPCLHSELEASLVCVKLCLKKRKKKRKREQ